MSIEEAAIDYVKRGFVVIPLKGRYGADKDDAKRPLVKWEKWISGTRPDEKTVREWFQKKPNADVALLTGPTNGIFVVDVDGEKGQESIKGKPLFTPMVNVTPRGNHHVFKWDARLDSVSTTKVGILPGVDTRGKGGYIVAPPSFGKSEVQQYARAQKGEEDIKLNDLPLPPEWLVQLLLQAEAKVYAEVPKPENWFQEIYGGVKQGENRHKAMTKLASYYFSLGLPEDDIALLMNTWNERCTPPREEGEFQYDLDKFLENWRSGRYKADGTVNEPSTEFKVQKLSEFMGEEEEHIDWRVDKLIPAESITFLNGYSGLGKSWLTLSLAIEMERGGGTWLGRKVKGGKVLYIDLESHKALLKHRFGKLLNGQGLTKEKAEVTMLSVNDLKLDNPATVDALKGLLVEVQPSLVVFDPFIALHSGNENSTADMSKLRTVFKSIIKDCSCGIIIIDHESKPNDLTKTAAQRQRGSSEKGAVADVTLSLVQSGDSLILEHAKARWGTIEPSVEIKIEDTGEKSTVIKAMGVSNG